MLTKYAFLEARPLYCGCKLSVLVSIRTDCIVQEVTVDCAQACESTLLLSSGHDSFSTRQGVDERFLRESLHSIAGMVCLTASLRSTPSSPEKQSGIGVGRVHRYTAFDALCTSLLFSSPPEVAFRSVQNSCFPKQERLPLGNSASLLLVLFFAVTHNTMSRWRVFWGTKCASASQTTCPQLRRG